MSSINFPELEEKILASWKKKKIFEKSLKKNPKRKRFVFFEGPPTANGKPGVHHVLARVYKDVIPRYKTMQGYFVDRKSGWDTHGLPVELQIEKAMGFKNKTDIENFGIAEFNKKCQESVWQYKEEFEKLTERIGFWVDLKHPYITYNRDYIESLFWVFKTLWEKNLVYKGFRVVPHCPRCGTALSSHELALGYKEVEDTAVYAKFRLKDESNTFILAWTTTPWTLPGNVGLAVGKKFRYVKVMQGNEYLILAKDRLEVLHGEHEIVEEFSGEKLLGKEYESLFPGAIKTDKKGWYVLEADFVTTDDGTGVVHTAVMYGEDDYKLGQKKDLPMVHTVDEGGKFMMPGELHGKFVKSKATEELIEKHLQGKNLLYKKETYKHDYPFCWRCDTPLLYYAKSSWFIAMSGLKKQLLEGNEKINWYPAYIQHGRFGQWLKEVKDWAISRERYWGTPLPIWECAACGATECMGSLRDIEKRSGKKLPDSHRPFIDEILWKCSCGGEMKRVPEVADCWFDSGAMPYAQWHYPFQNKAKIDKKESYPADYISEAIDQTRGWFYTLLAVATALGKERPYKNVVCLGLIMDKNGKKMSKSKGNVINPWEIINQYGVDALRFYLFTVSGPGDTKNFDPDGVKETLQKNFLLLSNVLSFLKLYQPKASRIRSKTPSSKHALDTWILARISELTEEVTNRLDRYEITEAGRAITNFIQDLSTWYVRRSRDRMKNKDPKALQTLQYTLLQTSKILAPFAPFFSDFLYKEVGGIKESVHLDDFPKPLKFQKKVLSDMQKVREIVEKALAKRAEAKIKIRQPLQTLTLPLVLNSELRNIIAEEINVKEVKSGKQLHLSTKITEELQQEGMARELIRHVNMLRKEMGLTVKDRINIFYATESANTKKIFETFGKEILEKTLAKKLETSAKSPASSSGGKHIPELSLWLKLTKRSA